MAKEVAAIVATYLDGAGIVAWQENPEEDGYESVTLPDMPTVETIDVALWRIETEIKEAVTNRTPIAEPEPAAPIDLDQLADDEPDQPS